MYINQNGSQPTFSSFQFCIYMWITLHQLQNEWRKGEQNEMRHSKVKKQD